MNDISPFSNVIERFQKFGKQLSRYISASANSYLNNDAKNYNANNVLDSSSSIYHSDNILSWIKIDFIKYSVRVENVRIQVSTNRDPMSWVIEGSTDGITFATIHENKDIAICDIWNEAQTYHCAYQAYKTFDVKHGIYKSIRLRQTGQDSGLLNYLVIGSISVYGNILMKCANSRCVHQSIKTFHLLVVTLQTST